MVDNSWLCAYICYNFKINMQNMDVKLYCCYKTYNMFLTFQLYFSKCDFFPLHEHYFLLSCLSLKTSKQTRR